MESLTLPLPIGSTLPFLCEASDSNASAARGDAQEESRPGIARENGGSAMVSGLMAPSVPDEMEIVADGPQGNYADNDALRESNKFLHRLPHPQRATTIKFGDMYELCHRLSAGSYGTVYTCRHKSASTGDEIATPGATRVSQDEAENEYYAVKMIEYGKFQSKSQGQHRQGKPAAHRVADVSVVHREIAILQDVRDLKFVTHLVDVFVSLDICYLVQPYAAGGDVFTQLTLRAQYTEHDAQQLALTLLHTVRHLHLRNIVHRDIKPENLLLMAKPTTMRPRDGHGGQAQSHFQHSSGTISDGSMSLDQMAVDSMSNLSLPDVNCDSKDWNISAQNLADATVTGADFMGAGVNDPFHQGGCNILLADFGFARYVPQTRSQPRKDQRGEDTVLYFSDDDETDDEPPPATCRTLCGTPSYVAPEILRGEPYGTSVDLWSAGCMIFMLMGGYPPFQGENHRELFRRIRAGDFVFHEAYWKNVSVDAKKLISNLLTVNPKLRLTAKKAVDDTWFRVDTADKLRSHDLSLATSKLSEFTNVARARWKKAAQAIGYCATAKFWATDAIAFSQQLAEWDQLDVASVAKTGTGTHRPDGIPASSLGDTAQPPAASSQRPLQRCRVRFHDMYDMGMQIRTGSCATVWECRSKKTQEIFAVKVIRRANLTSSDDEVVLNEVAMMQALSGRNKHVVELLDFYEEQEFFFMVMEKMEGGDVFDRIVSLNQYSENDARDLVLVLLQAVGGMHKQGICHRDLKPQNLLLQSFDSHASIKVADFGFACRVHMQESLTKRVGTPSYVAPEILKNLPHDQRVDLWSIGVIVFVLLVGYPPFMEDNQAILFDRIRRGNWEFEGKDWENVSQEAKNLIRGLLVVDPKERWTIDDALGCPWIRADASLLSSRSLHFSLSALRDQRARLRGLARAAVFFGKDAKAVESRTKPGESTPEADQKLESTRLQAVASVVAAAARFQQGKR
jgi:calcium/calmodulin-dependent protein kinase I